jgi:hypothetical protein
MAASPSATITTPAGSIVPHAAGFCGPPASGYANPLDPALAARLQQSGPENVDGLQGNPVGLVRPQDAAQNLHHRLRRPLR